MNQRPFRAVGISVAVAALASSLLWAQAQLPNASAALRVEGLNREYSSCGLVNFTIRNTSKRDVHVNVYVERLVSGSWNDEVYPYAINDPASLYSKMLKVDFIKPGETLPIAYDRCLRPRFVKQDEKAFRSEIEQRDAEAKMAGTPASQRIRVEIREWPTMKVADKVWSQPFTRTKVDNAGNRTSKPDMRTSVTTVTATTVQPSLWCQNCMNSQ